MATSDIVIRGAREHNLRDVSLDLAPGRLICFTGVSGSGKSSLAFDTLYAEGQRRYVESLSSYARQFLGQMPKPEVDRIDGLSPVDLDPAEDRRPEPAVDRRHDHRDQRLPPRALRPGRPGALPAVRPAGRRPDPRADRRPDPRPARRHGLQRAGPGDPRARRGSTRTCSPTWPAPGTCGRGSTARCYSLTDNLSLDRQIKHNIEVVIDRLKAGPERPDPAGRGRRAGPQAGRGDGDRRGRGAARPAALVALRLHVLRAELRPAEPPALQLQQPPGDVPGCDGLGVRHDFDPDLLVPDPSLSVWDGAIAPLGPVKDMGKWRRHIFEGVAANLEADPDGPPKGTMLKGPWHRPRRASSQRVWLHGTGDRVIVHHWKNRRRGLVARREVGRRGHRAAGPLPQVGRRADPGQARALHAEHDLPRLPGRPARTRAPGPCGSAARRWSSWARCRSATPPVLRCPGRCESGRLAADRSCARAARPRLADDRRGTAQGDPRPARVPDRRRACTT